VSRSPLIAAGLLVALVVAGCGSSSGGASSGGSSKASTTQVIEISLTDEGCDPHEISAKAGPTTFKVSNDDSADVTEFEVLKGKSIVGEKENIAPGLSGNFSVNLEAGSYTTNCTNGKKPKGTLEVAKAGTGETANGAARKKAVATYLAYVTSEVDKLVPATEAFAAAVTAGDVTKAESLFAGARYHYESIEPIAESFGNLDPKIDARDGDVPAKDWGGFHFIEQSLFVNNTTNGMAPVAADLVTNVKDLQTKIHAGLSLEPSQIANGAVELLNEVSSSKITGEEDRYSGTDLSDFAANVEGAQQAFDAVKPLLAGTQDALVADIDQRFTDVFSGLDVYKDPTSIANGYAIYTPIKDDASKTSVLSEKVDALAEPLSKVAALVLQ
jgi:iron uptake system component EfeO